MQTPLTKLILSGMIALMPIFLQAEAKAAAPAQTAPAPQTAQPTAQAVPTFSLTNTAGKKITIVETPNGLKFPTLPGKNVMVMFYIYPGTPCRDELQMFSTKIKPKYPDLEFVTFELKGLTPDKLRDFEKELNLKDLNMIDAKQALPFADYIAKRIRWQGSVPLLILADKNGTVKHMQLGAMTQEQTEGFLNKL